MRSLVLVALTICRICDAEGSSEGTHGLRGAEGLRRLQISPVDAMSPDWTWPSPTTLEIGVMTADDTQILRTSSVTYTTLRISGPISSSFGLQHDYAKVKLVLAGTKRTNCSSSAFDVPMSLVKVGAGFVASDMAKGTTMDLDNSQGFQLEAVGKRIRFMNGGNYQLCYAPDGTMLDGDSDLYNGVVPTIIKVLGVSFDCSTDGCLANQRWDCNFNYRRASQPACILKVAGTQARSGWGAVEGSTSVVSWTSAWAPNTMSNGDYVAEHPKYCTESEPERTKLEHNIASAGVVLNSGVAVLPQPSSSTKSSFTVSVCYCPSYVAVGSNLCTANVDFVQQFGRLYFWTLEICDTNYIDSMCLVRYLNVMPMQAFRLRVLCPPGQGCASDASDNQMKFVASSEPNIQSWESSHPCQGSAQSPAALWQSDLNGGEREDYKDFHPSNPPRLNLAISAAVDVCYCDSGCGNSENWLQVGKIQTTDFVAIASATAATGGVGTLRYVGKPGSVALYGGLSSENGPVHPYDIPKFSSDSFVNLISYDRLTVRDGSTIEKLVGADRGVDANFQSNMDIECQTAIYQPDLISEFSSSGAFADYIAVPEHSDPRFLPFDGVGHNMTLTAVKAGMLAVCYCGNEDPASGTCSGPGAKWFFIDRLLILGPRGDQIWNVATGITFSLTVHGWGLEGTNYLRISAAGSDCSPSVNASSPIGITSGILIGCPSEDGSSCEEPREYENFNLLAEDSSSTNVFITTIATSATKTTLTFGGDIIHHLSNDDVISLSVSELLVGGKTDEYWTPHEALDAQRLAGIIEFPDNNTDTTGPNTRLLGQKVTLVEGQSNQVTIPVGWAVNPGFSFKSNAGSWTKHNRLSTTETTKATSALSDLVVCWSALDQGQRLYASAGKLNIVDPPAMASAKLSFTTIALGVVAPVVISFATSSSSFGYATTPGETVLIFRFLDLDNVVPKLVADSIPSGSVPGDFPASSSVSPSAAFQSTCGQILLELWSNDDSGFPMPAGCYYTKQYRDKGSSRHWRDFVLVFENGNGLKHQCIQGGVAASCEYHVAMNAAIHSSSIGINPLEIFSKCQACAQQYQAIEYANIVLNVAAETVASASEMQLRPDGFLLLDVTDKVKTLDSAASFRFRLSGTSSASQAIVPGARLHIFLWPLFAWDVVNATCRATCAGFTSATSYNCGPETACSTEGVVSGNYQGHQNILKLTMPSNMDAITNNIAHTFTINDLVLPNTGWFPVRMGVQLTSGTGHKPSYTTSDGFTYKVPDSSASSARILVSGRTGQGSRPFIYDSANSVMLRLVLGATLWSNGQSEAGRLRITLPSGYTCSSTVTSTGAGAIPSTHPIFTIDVNQDGRRDHAFANIGSNVAEGQWSNLLYGSCDYVLMKDMVLFAGTVLVARIAIGNPSFALSNEDSSNRWQMDMFGKGFSTRSTPWNVGAIDFISLAEANSLGPSLWASNMVVMTPLSPNAQSLQPASFAKGDIHDVQVFFKPIVSTGRSAYVILDAPAGFDFKFGDVCEASDLGSQYYATLSYPSQATERLDRIDSCVPLQWETIEGHNRARIHVTRGLVSGTWYGFAMKVKNPLIYTATMANSGWLVWTQNTQGVPLEGSSDSSPMRLNLASVTSLSWGIYDQSLAGMQILFPSSAARPSSMYGSALIVRFLGLTVPSTGSYALRVTAPYGYQFKKHPDNQAYGFLANTAGTTADMVALPVVNQNSELIWTATSFISGETYGFETQVIVPDRPSTIAASAFVVEFGYTSTSLPERLQAVAIPAPTLQSLINCDVGYVGNVMAYASNYLQFTIQTASYLPLGGGIVISASGDQFQIQCPALPMNAHSLPIGTACTITNSPTTIKLQAGVFGIPARFYQFEFQTMNPPGVAGPYTWTFATYNDTQTDPPTLPVDKEALRLGFPISAKLDEARIVWLTMAERYATGRNDRPDQANALIIQFRIGGAVFGIDSTSSSGTMYVRAPQGFEFSENCLSTVVTSKHLVFMANASLYPSYAAWPTTALPTECSGNGPLASLVLGSGLANANLYAFRIGVHKNPTVTPTRNLWSIEFSGMSIEPFLGFDIWTFTDTSVKPASTSRLLDSTLDTLPVAVRFRPQNTVPSGVGLLVLTAPNGFTFAATSGTSCSAELAMIFSSEYQIYDDVEMNCSLTTPTELVLQVVGARPLQAGQLYSLSVQTQNPSVILAAGTWRLRSFLASPQSAVNALDDVVIAGYAVTEAISSWAVTNVQNILKGTHLAELTFSFALETDILQDDVMQIFAPTGIVQFITDGCTNFSWTSVFVPDYAPSCPCSANTPNCALSLEVNTTVPQNTAIAFKVSMQNPSNMPLQVDNAWKLVHLRSGNSMASRAVASWSVQPQLSGVQVLLIGSKLAAGAISTIKVVFVPVNTAGAVNLTAVTPAGFDFRDAQVSLPHVVDTAGTNGPTIVVKTSIIFRQAIDLVITNVQLASSGGPTTFHLLTMANSSVGLASKLDELLDFKGGFRQPGKLFVQSALLTSQYAKTGSATYPVRSQLQPRVQERGWLQFVFNFTEPVENGNVLKIANGGLALHELVTFDLEFKNASLHQMHISVTRPSAQSLRIMLLENLLANETYHVNFWATPLGVGPSLWNFETEDLSHSQYPTNTNDGNVFSFEPLEQIQFSVSVERAPPAGVIDVTLTLPAATTIPGPLHLVPPDNFNVAQGSCGRQCIYAPFAVFPGTFRNIVNMTNETGHAPLITAPRVIQLLLPPTSPSDMGWILLSYNDAGAITAWGSSVGFLLDPMRGVSIYYNALLSSHSMRVIIAFESRVSGGTEIVVQAPLYYRLYCRTEGALKQLALPGENPICRDHFGSTDIFKAREVGVGINGTVLGIGEYAFGVLGELPQPSALFAALAVDGIDGRWSVMVRTNLTVVESIYDIPPLTITNASVSSPVLAWSLSEASQISDITMGFRVDVDLLNARAVLFVFPQRIWHNVQNSRDFRLLGESFPATVNAQNLLTTEMSLLRLNLANGSVIPAGIYRFQFPVMLPREMPTQNLWHIALCTTTTCLTPDDSSLLVSFVLAGFNLGERSNAQLIADQASSHAARQPSQLLRVLACSLIVFSLF